jgi:hypothetical protein
LTPADLGQGRQIGLVQGWQSAVGLENVEQIAERHELKDEPRNAVGTWKIRLRLGDVRVTR